MSGETHRINQKDQVNHKKSDQAAKKSCSKIQTKKELQMQKSRPDQMHKNMNAIQIKDKKYDLNQIRYQ